MGRRMKKLVENHWFRGSVHFHSKNVGETIEYSRCLPLPCFNKFVLTLNNFNCIVRYKTIPTLLCKDRGDALMKLLCSGLLSSIEVGICYLRKWR